MSNQNASVIEEDKIITVKEFKEFLNKIPEQYNDFALAWVEFYSVSEVKELTAQICLSNRSIQIDYGGEHPFEVVE